MHEVYFDASFVIFFLGTKMPSPTPCPECLLMRGSEHPVRGVIAARSIQSDTFLSDGQISPIGKNVENRACPNLDAMSVPEALVHSIRILEAPAVYLKHRWLKS